MRRGWLEERQGTRGVSIRCRYWAPDASGELVPRSASFPAWKHGGVKAARAAATAFLAEQLTRVRDGSYVPPSDVTLAQLIEDWLAARADRHAPSTVYLYRKSLKHLDPAIAALPIQRLKPGHLQAMYARLKAAGVGPAAIWNLHKVLAGALNQAVRWDLLQRSPAAGVELRQPEPAPKTIWTLDQVAAFLAAEGDDPDYGAAWRLGFGTGMRMGELFALRWDDVDFARGTVAVRRTITRTAAGRHVVGSRAKTERSHRTVPLPASCVEPLRAHRKRVLERRLRTAGWSDADGDLIFPGSDGRMLHPSNARRLFGLAVARTGLPPLTLHGMRHCFVTAAIAAGIDPTTVAALIGDSLKMVLRVYSHVSVAGKEAAIALLDERLAAATPAPAVRSDATT